MKQFRYLIIALLAIPFFSMCERKEIMTYEGKDAIYFDVQYGADWGNENVWAHQYYSYVPFGELSSSVYEAKLKVGVAGSVVDYDRPFQIEVVADSTTAIAGEDYDELSLNQVIKAGEVKTYITFKIYNTEKLLNDTIKLQLRLIPNEYFELPFSDVGEIPGRWPGDTKLVYNKNADPTVHTIFANNLLTRPKGWMAVYGNFSPKKYQMLMDVSGYSQEDFNDQMKMIYGRGAIVQRKASAYLKEQFNKGREYWVLDEDGSLMWVSGVTWGEGTRPEEIVIN